MIELGDLEYIYDIQTIDEYQANEEHLKTADWNNRMNKLLHIAFYIILHSPKPKTNIKEKRLQQIRKIVSEIKLKVLKGKSKRLSCEWFSEAYDENHFYGKTFYELNIEGRLGKYAKYFIRESSLSIEYEDILDTKKKYIQQNGCYVLNCYNGTYDEVEVLKVFFTEAEGFKDKLLQEYSLARQINKRKKGVSKPSNIDEKIKGILRKRLQDINVSSSKIERILPRAIKAIKQEIVHI